MSTDQPGAVPAPPPDLRGRGRPDRMFTMLGKLISILESIASGCSVRRRPPQQVDHALTLLVDEVRAEADDARSFRLVAASGAQLPRWQPGSHLQLLLPSGRRRHYSLCGDPADHSSYRIAVRRLAGGAGGSRELHDSIGQGSALAGHGPRNAFPFVQAASYLFIAGGIGITPILPMVRQAAAGGAPWHLVYTGRSRASMPFLDELRELDQNRVQIRPYDRYGFPSGAELLACAPEGSTVYCCGPAPLIAGVRQDFAASAAVALHFERFTAAPILDGVAFEVALQRSNRLLTVPADRSALAVIREALPDVAFSCQQGFCGTCRTRVLSGDIEHRDRVLLEHERADTMTICVSRSRGGRIALDL